VKGVDASAKNVEIATQHAKAVPDLQTGPGSLTYEAQTVGMNVTFRKCIVKVVELESLVDKEARKYDVVCALEILEHVSDPSLFLRACTELVKVRSVVIEFGI
jgi:2-polyprenyl-6-hydroxyphenyl methylase/3-demethylubiquinone-9 3-methyltransferase